MVLTIGRLLVLKWITLHPCKHMAHQLDWILALNMGGNYWWYRMVFRVWEVLVIHFLLLHFT